MSNIQIVKDIVDNNWEIKDFKLDSEKFRLFLQNEVNPRTRRYLKDMGDDCVNWIEWSKFASDMFKLKVVGAITNIEMRNYLDSYWK